MRTSAVWRENGDKLLPGVQDAASFGDQCEQPSCADASLEKLSQLSSLRGGLEEGSRDFIFISPLMPSRWKGIH